LVIFVVTRLFTETMSVFYYLEYTFAILWND